MRISIYLSLMCCFLQCAIASAQTFAIPDANFRDYLKTRIPSAFNANNELIISQAKAYSGDISCDKRGINTLSGLEFFHNITLLNCTFNNLTSLPALDSLTNLRQIWAHDNQLSMLPQVSQLTNLEVLNVKTNKLTSLPALSNLSMLKELDCSGNRLTALPPLNSLSNLELMYVYNNSITEFPPINNLTKLRVLDLQANKLSVVPDVTNNTNLTILRCDNNLIKVLPSLKHLTLLKELGFARNQIKKFPQLSPNSTLVKIIGSDNFIDTLPDLSAFTGIKELKLTNNFLSFSDMLPLLGLPKFDSIVYLNPQRDFVIDTRVDGTLGASLEINAKIDVGVEGNRYTWYKDSVKVTETTTPFLPFERVNQSDGGSYTCKITNNSHLLADITLHVGVIQLKLLPCITISTINYELLENDCKKGAHITIEDDDIEAKYLPLTAHLISSFNENDSYTTQLPGEINNIKPGFYSLRIEDVNQCGLELRNYIQISNPTNCTNSFTPNGDGLEDTFFIEQKGKAMIYTKEGKLVHTLNVPNAWNGKDREGELVPMGLYLIIVDDNTAIEVVVIQ